MIGNISNVKVLCKKCGKYANSSDFVLDPVFKLMVCPSCVKDRKMRENIHNELDPRKQKKPAEEQKPEGWDSEDDYLNKAYNAKMKNAVQVERMEGDKVKYTCPKCKYKFTYDTAVKKPNMCPYCSMKVSVIHYF